jgi:cob(I)alamin adenosyltransferase
MEIFSFAALIIAAIGVYVAVNSNKTKSDQEYVKQLETRIERLKAKLEKCELESTRLMDENIALLKRVVGVD